MGKFYSPGEFLYQPGSSPESRERGGSGWRRTTSSQCGFSGYWRDKRNFLLVDRNDFFEAILFPSSFPMSDQCHLTLCVVHSMTIFSFVLSQFLKVPGEEPYYAHRTSSRKIILFLFPVKYLFSFPPYSRLCFKLCFLFSSTISLVTCLIHLLSF